MASQFPRPPHMGGWTTETSGVSPSVSELSSLQESIEAVFLHLVILVDPARQVEITDLDLDLDRERRAFGQEFSQSLHGGVTSRAKGPLVADGIELSRVPHADPT